MRSDFSGVDQRGSILIEQVPINLSVNGRSGWFSDGH